MTPSFRPMFVAPLLRAAAALCSVLVTALAATPLRAQDAREVQGRVVRPALSPTPEAGAARGADSTAQTKGDTAAVTPVPGVMVTLHRVGSDSEAPLDSVRTRADGRYAFKYKTSGVANAVYFTSATWDGVTYFTAPFRTALVSGENAEITVFDATTNTFPLKVAGRHLIVSALDTATNHRTVIEVFELSNDSMKTLSSGDEKSGKPTWSIGIPNVARDVKANEGEISAAAFSYENNRVSILSAIAPGIKQVSFSYRIPNEAFPMSFELEGGATVMEVLLEDPNGTVTGAGLVSTNPQAIENRTFRRFLAQDVPAGAVIDVNMPAGASVGRNLYVAALLGTIGVVMLMILLRAMQRNKKPSYVGLPPVQVADAPLADRLAREIADLDATFAKYENPTDAVRNAYEERRAELKDALSAEMARG
ncbi:MAG: hypothetical protein ACO1Q7_14635 [Gemmatimonas sp.]